MISGGLLATPQSQSTLVHQHSLKLSSYIALFVVVVQAKQLSSADEIREKQTRFVARRPEGGRRHCRAAVIRANVGNA